MNQAYTNWCLDNSGERTGSRNIHSSTSNNKYYDYNWGWL